MKNSCFWREGNVDIFRELVRKVWFIRENNLVLVNIIVFVFCRVI